MNKFSFKNVWKNDLLSGFIIFLIALPLSLGIAMASGVPPMAGLISAIVGGLIVSRISGSHVTINGPAAGLIVVVLHGVETLGHGDPTQGYTRFLAVSVVAGALLALAGLLKAGKLGEVFPSSVIHGMLAAIGVIIMAKQFHALMGVAPEGKTTLALLAEIPKSIGLYNPEIAIIGVVSLILLIGLPKIPVAWISKLPAPMVVVLVGMALGRVFDLEHQHAYLFLDHHEYTIGPKFLVSLPARFWDGFATPSFGVFSQDLTAALGVLVSLTLIQGIETVLSAAAVDHFDPYQRKTNLNRDLSAVGMGTLVASSMGGLPMIAEIVRSRANVSNGAKSPWSNFFHGAFIFLFVAFFPHQIHLIPLASLAAILIVTGYRLASPSQFAHTLHIGKDQLLVFTVTLVTTIATDLLVGVATGVALKVFVGAFFAMSRGVPLSALLKPDMDWKEKEGEVTLFFRKAITFTNFLKIRNKLDALPRGRRVVLNFSEVSYIDHTTMEKLTDFISEYETREGRVEVQGLTNLKATSAHPLASRRSKRA